MSRRNFSCVQLPAKSDHPSTAKKEWCVNSVHGTQSRGWLVSSRASTLAVSLKTHRACVQRWSPTGLTLTHYPAGGTSEANPGWVHVYLQRTMWAPWGCTGIKVLIFYFSASPLCVYSMTDLGCSQLPRSTEESEIKEMGIINDQER